MFQFSIRSLLFWTLFAALACVFWLEGVLPAVLTVLAWLLHFCAMCILPVVAFEVHGERRRFFVAAFVFDFAFLLLNHRHWDDDAFGVISLFALAGAYVAGTLSAAAYCAIALPGEPRGYWRPLHLVTRVLIWCLGTKPDTEDGV
ncbi:hypothetical protein RISK_005119 [Rhodopirellula islandica]|uniref:Transmembrane protein n=1 Tax=Rhodopirellula islandica TaxID=595434 RepID=A0A0J1B8D1_RHOIS|nr:hypothetical protein [Rhodopirellula islandica]KLU02823.1 hypothetical protein RISK_005119 [Rhodopirellula islandica]